MKRYANQLEIIAYCLHWNMYISVDIFNSQCCFLYSKVWNLFFGHSKQAKVCVAAILVFVCINILADGMIWVKNRQISE